MDALVFHYQFLLNNERWENYELVLNAETLEVVNRDNEPHPDWTRLEFNQCQHCPLQPQQHPYCPVALQLIPAVNLFNDICSYEEIELQVQTEERCISQRTTAQRGLSSLLGLLIATSGCPYTNYLKPMARFHLPLATEDETLYRAVGMFLLAQYLRKQQGQQPSLELDGLKQIYEDLHQMNKSIAERLRHASEKDSSVNAVVILDMFTNLMPFAIDENMQEIRSIFSAYLAQDD
ncbi:MAG: hypothetical protein OQK12_01875 [Motiliproteus sp.]|nr:hypothetical protein [Motiliproteus sp.]MCW9051645.1 hypothetical protein [Motiliproteus sp.]